MRFSAKVNVLFGAVVFCVGAGYGDVAVFPNADGSGDLASDDAWGDVAHGSDVDVELRTKDATYVSSADLEFVSISWTKPCTIDFSATPTRKVTLAPSSNTRVLFPGGSRDSDGAWENDCGLLHIKGGIWDFGGVGSLQSVKGYNRSRNSQLKIDGGAVVTNTRGVQVAYHAANNSMIVTGGSRVYDGGGVRLRDGGAAYSLFEVSGGAYYEYQSGNLYLSNGGSYNTNLVTGSDTVFTNAASEAVVFSKARNTEIIVTDHAKVYMPHLYYGQETAASNNLEVSGGASLHFRAAMYVNYSAQAFANNLRILDGGVCSSSGAILVNGSGQSEIVVSNAALSCHEFRFGGIASSTGNTVRIIGPDAVFAPRTFVQFFYMGCFNRYVFDGCCWTNGNMYCSSNDSGTNRIELVNGAKMKLSGMFRFQNYGGNVAGACGNTLFVGDGCELNLSQVVFAARDNSLVISNGTYVGYGAEQSLMLSATSDTSPASGNSLVIQGARPRMYCPNGTAYFCNNSILAFDVPAEGYDVDEPLVSLNAMSDDGTTTIKIEGALAEWQKRISHSVDVTLVESTGGVAFSSAEIEAANEALPDKCSVYKSSDGKSLILHVGSLAGTMLIVR